MTSLHRITLLLLCLAILVSFIAPSTTHAASYAVQNGDWNNAATWGGIMPENSDPVTIPSGITVTIPNEITVTRQAGLYIDGILVNNGTLNNTLGIQLAGTLTNNGTLNSSMNLYINGTLTNNSGAIFTTLSNVYNWGTFNNAGTFTIDGNLGGIGNGSPEHEGTMNNSGTVINNNWFNNYSQLNNNGSITNNASFVNRCSAVISGNAITGNPVYHQLTAVAPILNSPSHRDHTTNTVPSFTWNSVTGAQSYRLMIYLGDRSFEYKKRIFTNNYTLDASEALPYAGKYLWRVRTQDSVCSTWSGWSERNTLFLD